ncbi:SAM-dependent methyltransferase [Nonomuraea sp. NBC_00507]|uniref:SAM-dependent methyltransferase n=1 Tax=Nonomuraea sp. NBC_00507 TaxID=2976002 RepID=UPI002E17417A
MTSPEARNSGKGGSAALDADLLGHQRTVVTISTYQSGSMESPQIDPNRPNVARMYDYWLGGKDNFPADRQAAERASRANPNAQFCAWANRAFLGRAVRFLAKQGIRQFLDVGSGLPAVGNVHEVAQSIEPGARTVCVDYDPIVSQHGRALLATDERTTMVQMDLRNPEFILDKAAGLLNFDFPVAVLLVATLHFITDEEDPHGIVKTLMECTEPGSYLVVSHVLETPTTIAAAGAGYKDASAGVTLRSEAEISGFFAVTETELLDPGLVRVPLRRPEVAQPLAEEDAAKVDFLGGVGRKER